MRVQRIKTSFHTLGFVLAVALSMGGCSGSATNAAKLLNVEVGMTQKEVLAIMGQPPRTEIVGSTEFLIYPTDGNIIPIAIVDGRVTGIGRNLYDTVVRSKAQSDLKGK
jgi:hypothetical protein